MFVVKRPFRDAAGMVTAGSIVEPAGIRRFKHRVLEGHIVEVTEHNFDKYAEFFKKRFGADLPPIEPAVPEELNVTSDEVEHQTAPENKVEAKTESAPAVKVEANPTEVKKVVVTAK